MDLPEDVEFEDFVKSLYQETPSEQLNGKGEKCRIFEMYESIVDMHDEFVQHKNGKVSKDEQLDIIERISDEVSDWFKCEVFHADHLMFETIVDT